MMLWPKTLSTRLILLVLATLVLVQGLSVLVYLKDRNAIINDAGIRLVVHRIAALVRLVDQAEPSQYPTIFKATENTRTTLQLSPDPTITDAASAGAAADIQAKLYQISGRTENQPIRVAYNRQTPPDNDECRDARPDKHHEHDPFERHDHRKNQHFRDFPASLCDAGKTIDLTVSVLLANGEWLNIRTAASDSIILWNWRAATGLLLVGILVIGLMLWMLRSNTRPLQKLADAADKIGRGIDTEALAEEGAEEVRSTIQAFNRMQERQQRFIRDRTLMLAAISHDLRTPITKLRLQTEFVADRDIQNKMLKTLADMENMLSVTMHFARDEVQHEPSRLTDLSSLVQSLCDDLSATTDAMIDMQLPDRLVCMCKPGGIRRMVTNVLENAIRYADKVSVTLQAETGQVVLLVADNGPGIDESLFEQVFTPFYRVETSRNRETGGMGLGLSVVRSIAHLHGGDVRLGKAKEGGLLVEIRLPC